MTVLVAVIVINGVVSLFGFRALRDGGGRAAESYLFIPNQVARGENGLGMLLAHFAHGGFAHLAFNMIALYSFSGTVITVLGPAKFLLIYAVAGLGADLVVFALHKEDPTYRCLGAPPAAISQDAKAEQADDDVDRDGRDQGRHRAPRTVAR